MPKFQLRGYQEASVNLVRAELYKGHKKILLVLPTGAGKTHILGDVASKAILKGHKILALMHRRQLVDQMVDRFTDCEIESGKIMSGVEPELSCSCQVSTIQTYSRRIKLEEIQYNQFFINASVVFIDEAHHVLSKSYQKVLEHYEDKIVIGVTATPCLSSGVGMGEYFDTIVQPVSVSGLVDKGYLVPGEYYGPSAPDLSKVKTVMGDYEKKALSKKMNTPKLVGDVVGNWGRIAGGLQTMVFAVDVKHSKALVMEFERHGISAEHLDAYCDDETREATLNRFRNGDTRVICNVGLYTEGTDIPEIQCIDLARPTKSIGLHLQMVGRGARPYPGKEKFIVIDHGGNIERLGFYEDEIEWGLKGKKNAYKKKKVRKKEAHLFTCEMCSTIFSGKRCPMCFFEIKDWGRKIEAMDAELVALKATKKKYTTADKQKWFSMLKYYGDSKGYSPGWAAHKFREKMGVWPRGKVKDVPTTKPDNEVQGWITHGIIKYINSKKKQEAQAA